MRGRADEDVSETDGKGALIHLLTINVELIKMNETKRYFEKAHIIFDLLKDGNEVSVDTIRNELNVSNRRVQAALDEFNLFEKTIVFLDNEKVKFCEAKNTLTDCMTYNRFSHIIELFIQDPERYITGNEIEVAKELDVDRSIIQKLKALVKMNR